MLKQSPFTSINIPRNLGICLLIAGTIILGSWLISVAGVQQMKQHVVELKIEK